MIGDYFIINYYNNGYRIMGNCEKMKNEDKNNNSFFYAISNNNHELFHSNIWAWLINIDNNFAKVFFDSIDISSKLHVEREKYNMDIIIKDCNEKFYVIENKLKSLPNKDQLIKYRSKITKRTKNNKNKYLLVCLISNGVDVWDVLEYDKLCIRLRKMIKKEKTYNRMVNKYYHFLLEYCDYIGELCSIKNIKYVKNKKFNFDKDQIPDEYRNHEIVIKKLKGSKMKTYMDKRIDLESIDSKFRKIGFCLTSKLDFNHGRNTLTYRINKEHNDSIEHVGLEIQLEGDQFRYLVRLLKCKNDYFKKAKDTEFYYKKALYYFEKTRFIQKSVKIDKKVHGKTTNMIHNFNKYDSKKRIIGIYQYWIIDKTEKYDDVAIAIRTELNKIYSFITRPELKAYWDEKEYN